MGRLDLDAIHAEATETPHIVVLAGQEWSLPPIFPLVVAEHLQAGQCRDAIALLFGEDAVDVLSPVLGLEDIDMIAEALYDVAGKAQAVQSRHAALTASNGNRAQRRAAANS